MSVETGKVAYRGNESPRKRFLGLKVLTFLVIMALTAATFYVEKVKRDQQKEMQPIKELYHSLTQRAALMAETKNRRADFFRTRFFLDFPKQYAHKAADLIRRISLITPASMAILSIEVKPTDQQILFSYLCRDKGNTFAAFFERLEAFDDVMKVTFTRDEDGLYKITGEAELL